MLVGSPFTHPLRDSYVQAGVQLRLGHAHISWPSFRADFPGDSKSTLRPTKGAQLASLFYLDVGRNLPK